MVTTLESTITIHSAAVGAAVQSVKLTEKQEVNTMLVAHAGTGVAQHTDPIGHSKTVDFSVSGHGDLTFSTGLGQSHNLSLITGGAVFITQFEYEQNVAPRSKWTYNGIHYPYAA